MKNRTDNSLFLAAVIFLLGVFSCTGGRSDDKSSTFEPIPLDSVSAIARDAYIYAYPMLENYRVMYKSTQDSTYAKFAPLNTFFHERNVATAEDTLFVAPNGDTPYSYAVLDLRQGPVMLQIPSFEQDRYVGFPLYDLYTHIIYTFSKRTIGTSGGKFLIAPMGWEGVPGADIQKVIYAETDLVYILTRTQLFGKDDLQRVHALQNAYKLQRTTGTERNSVPAELRPALPPESPQTPPDTSVFGLFNYLLTFCHPLEQEEAVFHRFAKIGIKAGQPFEVPDSSYYNAVLKGIAEAKSLFSKKLPGYTNSSELFGTREQLRNDYLARAIGAWVGIYANQVEEFMGLHGVATEPDGSPLSGTRKYQLTFKENEFPPVDGFWSITLYNLPSRFMYDNVLHRNVLGSSSISKMKRNKDNSITLFIQHESPGKAWESNWLPAPDGLFTMSFRTYLPGEPIRSGTWKVPALRIIK